MFIQANTKVWDTKMKKCKTPEERSRLMLRSGNESVCIRINMKTGKEFYRPAVGKYTVHGIEENDDFKFDNVDDAIIKGEELRQQLIDELAALDVV